MPLEKRLEFFAYDLMKLVAVHKVTTGELLSVLSYLDNRGAIKNGPDKSIMQNMSTRIHTGTGEPKE